MRPSEPVSQEHPASAKGVPAGWCCAAPPQLTSSLAFRLCVCRSNTATLSWSSSICCCISAGLKLAWLAMWASSSVILTRSWSISACLDSTLLHAEANVPHVCAEEDLHSKGTLATASRTQSRRDRGWGSLVHSRPHSMASTKQTGLKNRVVGVGWVLESTTRLGP